MAIKKKTSEKLDDTNIKHVIKLLNQNKPITKKEACSILNISYNTTRLSKILEEYKDNQEFKAVRKAQNKGKSATDQEITQVIQDYLCGENISNISKSLYRSAGFVKSIIQKLGIPQKAIGDDRINVAILPDQCISNTFSVDEKVWSAVYHAPAIIIKKLDGYKKRYSSDAYRIYILEKRSNIQDALVVSGIAGFYATSLAYNIGSLNHLKKYNVNWDYI